jgi:DNA-directed RNA polymerase specialized sigma24 family protein
LTFTNEPFDALLEWLHPDRENAGERYETIRSGLIRIFVSKGLSDAEHYSDEVIDRVMKRLPEIRAGYVGDPAKYFHGVARNVLLEARRQREIPTEVVPERTTRESPATETSECLAKCLGLLPKEKRDLILDYYLYQGHAKIQHHRQMAEELSITEGALRTRAHHLRVNLEKCLVQCLTNGPGNEKTIQSHKRMTASPRSVHHS